MTKESIFGFFKYVNVLWIHALRLCPKLMLPQLPSLIII